MYPNLTPTLVVLLAAAAATAAFIAIRRPFLRKLALRQVARRRGEATLVVLGSVLGTAIIIGSLVVGDTLNYSVRQVAYTNLGPIDEIVASPTPAKGAVATARLQPLRTDPRVDGVLTLHGDEAAVVKGSGSARKAEPRVVVWDLNFGQAAAFGAAGGPSGLTGPAPGPRQVVLNAGLATALDARAGDVVTFFLYGRPYPFHVARVVPTWGLAGAGTTGVSRDAFFASGTLVAAAAAGGGRHVPQTFTFVSNAGGVE